MASSSAFMQNVPHFSTYNANLPLAFLVAQLHFKLLTDHLYLGISLNHKPSIYSS